MRRAAGPVAAALIAAAASAFGAGTAGPSSPSTQALIVRLKMQQPNPAQWQQLIEGSGLSARSGRVPPALRAVGRDQQRLSFAYRPSEAEWRQLAQRLRSQPGVEWIEPDVREPLAQAANAPSDPFFPRQWWLQPASGTNANAIADRLRGVPGFLRAWQSGVPGATGSAAAIVAVLDTGTTPHPELAGRFLPGFDFVSEAVFANDGDGRDTDPADPGDWVSSADLADANFAGCQAQDSTWHGSIIAGLIAAQADNTQGGAGIIRHAGGSRILPVRVAGKCGAALSDIIDGMRWAAGLPVAGVPANAHPARIVNISFGGSNLCGSAYQTAIDELRSIGVVVVASAGNGSSSLPTRPASCIGTIGVAALNRDGFKATYSNFGGALAASGVATVGGDDPDGRWGTLLGDGGLWSATNDGRRGPGLPSYDALYGTSFAAPLVSGTLALMLSVNPLLNGEQLMAGLRASARPHVTSPRIAACSDGNPGRCICSTATCGAGILDAEQALHFARAPDSYVPPARLAEVIDNPEVVQAVALGQDRGTAAVPMPEPPTATPSGGGGGSASAGWVLALALAVVSMRRRP